MQTSLNKIPVSEKLNAAVNESLEMIDKKYRKSMMRKVIVGCSTTVAGFAVLFVLCVNNPVLAANIPIIGRIFADVENDITFAGDYSNKAEMIATKDSTTSETSDSIYTLSDNGLTITASEVYCDGYSVYLALNIASNKESLGEICSYYTSREGKTSQYLYTEGTYYIGTPNKEIKLMNIKIEGKQTSDNSFKGIMKLDVENLRGKEGIFDLNLHLKGIGADTTDMMENSENNFIAPVMTNGTWEFKIPIKADVSNVKTFEIADKNAEGYGINNIVVTPYQILVDSIAPSETTVTQEELNELYAAKNNELIEASEKPIEYEKFLTQVEVLKECGVAIFDQSGHRVQWENEDSNKAQTFSIKGIDLKKLYVYIGTDFIDTVKETNQQQMEAKAVFKTEIDLSK